MEQPGIERRRARRLNLQAPVMIRPAGSHDGEPFQQTVTKNVSLSGIYFEAEAGARYAMNTLHIVSVAIPEGARRDFPFTRLAGPSRVVRITELPESHAAGRARIGVALEFGNDLSALTATPPR